VAIFRLIYVSRVSRHVRLADVEAIVSAAATRNTANGITGMLVYTPSHFLQVLEGDEAVISETLSRIRRDGRHSDVRVVDSRQVAGRQFQDWAMVARPLAGVGPREFDQLDAEHALELIGRVRD
jgi:hypothetical protein